MSRPKPLVAALAVATIAATALSACSSSSAKKTNGGTGGGTGGVFTSIDANNKITAGAPMNPYNAAPNMFLGYNIMELGFTKNDPADPNALLPGLAASWTASDTGLTIQLQPGAKWSDGTPVTAADIKTSLAIAYTQGTAGPVAGAGGTVVAGSNFEVSDVKDLGGGKIEIDQQPGVKNLYFQRLVLTSTIVNDKVYGSQLPADIWTQIAAVQGTDAAAASAASTKLAAEGKTIAAFAPAKDISAGPFVETRVNPGEALLDRNPYFYAASKISPKQVILRSYSGNQQIWGYMNGGELDYAPYTSMPTNILNQVLKAGYTRIDAPSYVSASIAFNEKQAPYNLTPVRQALAYVIDRDAVTKVGEPVGGIAAPTTTGLVGSQSDTILSADQKAALNPYKPDPAKAASLLQGAGFTKDASGQWHLPDGTPWKITLQTVNGFSDWIAASTIVANELTQFGIPTTAAITADFATYQKEMGAGKYAVGWWLVALGPQTDKAYARIYGSADGFSVANGQATHNDSAAGNWEHTPATYTVNGQSINPGQLAAQLSVTPVSAQGPIIAQLAAATNQEVPMIQIWNYTHVMFTLDKRFTNYPKTGQDDLLANPPGVWMMQGYVQGK
ncbi:extracellular solute-binding protein family 5 [Catenulispora acidiphila DSM 44928]|uniref:Extracellular solute-binding protein family 5 n=1 Tax=Catenulispora acidiphila (strain DSM 44928 / JCM 14897 / NBRC 102108 / NRRL B-24433 / ID139908) TaxID=479433 RepID=C7PWD3_CATAD|nr:ABC transporter substrate-binding protein [Catenulispora acidiphila]ACU73381.1 extracellular solute-binding protein family 5 [Catenulispora acidiphila DSM 44928]